MLHKDVEWFTRRLTELLIITAFFNLIFWKQGGFIKMYKYFDGKPQKNTLLKTLKTLDACDWTTIHK